MSQMMVSKGSQRSWSSFSALRTRSTSIVSVLHSSKRKRSCFSRHGSLVAGDYCRTIKNCMETIYSVSVTKFRADLMFSVARVARLTSVRFTAQT